MNSKVCFLLSLLALGPLSAQKKAPAAKKAPAPTAPAPVAPAEPKIVTPPPAPAVEQPAAAKSPDSALQLSALLWGGYNIASSETFDNATASSNLKKGGIAGGLEFLLGIPLVRGGFAVSYLPISSIAPEGSSGSTTKAFLPIEGVVNVYFMGFYLGGRGGYLVDIGSTTISGQSYTKTPGTSFGGQIGYQYSFGSLSVDVGLIYTFAHAEATGVHQDFNNLVPRLGVQYIF